MQYNIKQLYKKLDPVIKKDIDNSKKGVFEDVFSNSIIADKMYFCRFIYHKKLNNSYPLYGGTFGRGYCNYIMFDTETNQYVYELTDVSIKYHKFSTSNFNHMYTYVIEYITKNVNKVTG
jgi:hypothetical protein